MKLVLGTKLPARVREHVLRAYIYRWTVDNGHRLCAWSKMDSMPTMPLQTDDEWLADHAFYVTARGELSARHAHCEPHYLAND